MKKRGYPRNFVLVMAAIYSTTRFGMAASLTSDTERLLGRPPNTLRRFIENHKELWD